MIYIQTYSLQQQLISPKTQLPDIMLLEQEETSQLNKKISVLLIGYYLLQKEIQLNYEKNFLEQLKRKNLENLNIGILFFNLKEKISSMRRSELETYKQNNGNPKIQQILQNILNNKQKYSNNSILLQQQNEQLKDALLQLFFQPYKPFTLEQLIMQQKHKDVLQFELHSPTQNIEELFQHVQAESRQISIKIFYLFTQYNQKCIGYNTKILLLILSDVLEERVLKLQKQLKLSNKSLIVSIYTCLKAKKIVSNVKKKIQNLIYTEEKLFEIILGKLVNEENPINWIIGQLN